MFIKKKKAEKLGNREIAQTNNRNRKNEELELKMSKNWEIEKPNN